MLWRPRCSPAPAAPRGHALASSRSSAPRGRAPTSLASAHSTIGVRIVARLMASTTSVAANRSYWGSFSWSSFSYGGSQLETWLDFFLSWILSLSTCAALYFLFSSFCFNFELDSSWMKYFFLNYTLQRRCSHTNVHLSL